ncbi:MAG: hypothetical protein AAFP90_14185, partial [Planctomycetota bacterium]
SDDSRIESLTSEIHRAVWLSDLQQNYETGLIDDSQMAAALRDAIPPTGIVRCGNCLPGQIATSPHGVKSQQDVSHVEIYKFWSHQNAAKKGGFGRTIQTRTLGFRVDAHARFFGYHENDGVPRYGD